MEKARTWAQENRLEKKTGRDGRQAGGEGEGGRTAEVEVWEKKGRRWRPERGGVACTEKRKGLGD